MSGGSTDAARRTLAAPHLHERWEDRYHRAGNARLHDELIDELVDAVAPPGGGRALDAGCGPGLHSVRLARRGLRVTGVDFAAPALERARANAEAAGVGDRIEVERADLERLPFEDAAFDLVLCWGVLMHIPEPDRALAELCRVVAPGGALVLGEGNARSIDFRLRPGSRAAVRTPAGAERWRESAAGSLLIREADVGWLLRRLRSNGLAPRRPRVGELTEAYILAPPGSRLERAIHALNLHWFRRRWDWRPATGVFLIADRPG